MRKNIFYLALLVSLISLTGNISAQEDPTPLVRFWGVIENTEGESPDCDKIEDVKIIRSSKDMTYLDTVGEHDDRCHYSIDVESSRLSSEDTLHIQIDGIQSEDSIVYQDGTEINEDITVELPERYYGAVEGCTDPDAINYDKYATIDSGCEYPEYDDRDDTSTDRDRGTTDTRPERDDTKIKNSDDSEEKEAKDNADHSTGTGTDPDEISLRGAEETLENHSTQEYYGHEDDSQERFPADILLLILGNVLASALLVYFIIWGLQPRKRRGKRRKSPKTL